MSKKKIVFIINPKAGAKSKVNVADIIKSTISGELDYEIIYWEHLAQWPEIKTKILTNNYDIAVAVGGDGTVNQLARTLINTNISLAILPKGSGNGLARHLTIPLETKKAVELLTNGKEISIDSGFINDEAFFCTSGIGFDAHIGTLFAENKTRGFFTYLKMTLSELIKYQSQEYLLTLNGMQIKRKAFLITFANASQYGNNVYIAPKADIKDGMIDICILKPFKFWDVPGIGWRLFNKTAHRSSFIEMHKASAVEIIRSAEGPIHFDGEPLTMGAKIQIEIKPASLKVIVPQGFN